MPGSIKIDDGSGNYTILTNAGSLGSDKTLTIPNSTGTLATTTDVNNVTQGITEIDTWALTANVTSTGTITSNLARYNGTNAGYKGTGMTESSGIFTFPSTGFWLVSAGGHYGVGNDSGGGITIQATENNSDYSNIGYNWIGGTSSTIYFGNDNNFVLDITDTSNDKVRFVADDMDNITIYGHASGRATQFRFMRLGDT